jgi:hypothetical protein
MTLLQAYLTVLLRRADRACKPGKWRVFRDGARVVVERFA